MTATRSRTSRSVDPRMQARRRSVARKEGIRRLWVVAALTLIATLAIGAIAIANSSWLDIESVTVVGAQRASPQHIITASAIEQGEPLVEIDLDASAQAVEGVPWVADADVRRHWRGDVVIEVTERIGIAAFPTSERFAMVDRTGQQLEVLPGRPEGFLSIAGVDASGVPGQQVPPAGLAVIALIEAMTPDIAAVTSGVVIDDGELMVDLAVGGRATFGDERALAEKLIALETVLARVDLQCVALIDVRVPTAPTVRRTGLSAQSQEPLAGATGC